MSTSLGLDLPLAVATEIGPIEFQNQRAQPIRHFAFSPVDGGPHPVSGSMVEVNTALLAFNLSCPYSTVLDLVQFIVFVLFRRNNPNIPF